MTDIAHAEELRRRDWSLAIGLVLYGVLTVASTWPIALQLTDRLSMGSEPVRTVPLFNAWTLWWNIDRLGAGGDHYWDAPLFLPEKNTFAYSEPQPTAIIVTPVYWLSGSIALAYNLYLWIGLFLNGCVTQWCLRGVGVQRWVALGGGAAMLLLPMVHWQLGVIQLVPVWGIVWTWWSIYRLQKRGQEPFLGKTGEKAPDPFSLGVWLGVAFAVSFLMCVHHGLFLAVLLVGTSGWFGKQWFRLRTVLALGCAALISGVLISPVLFALHEMSNVKEFVRPRETVAQLSSEASDYLASYGQHLISIPAWGDRPGWWMSPGALKWILAGLAVCIGWQCRERRWWIGYLTITALLAFLLSLGANLRIGSWQPWFLIAEFVPGMQQVRNVFRFAYFVQIAVVLLAALGVDALLRRPGMIGKGIICVVGIWAVLDPWPYRQRLGVLPGLESHRSWLDHLQANSAEADGVLCLPMAGGQDVRDYEIETEWMIIGMEHRRPLANGYSGFFPMSYYGLQGAVLDSGLIIPTVQQLYRNGVRWIVMDRRRFSSPWGELWILGDLQARRVVGDGLGMDMYRLESVSQEPLR